MNKALRESKVAKFHLGIYALIENEQRVLLVKKSRGPYLGQFDLPGGRPIHGETILQTLQRELIEETGIELIDIAFLANQAFVVEYKDSEEAISLHHTCLIYQATRFDAVGLQETIAQEDVKGCSWVEKSSLTKLPLSKVVLSAMPFL